MRRLKKVGLTLAVLAKRGAPYLYKSRSHGYTQNWEPNLETPEVEEEWQRTRKRYSQILKGTAGTESHKCSKAQYPTGEIPFPRLETSLGTDLDQDQQFHTRAFLTGPAPRHGGWELGN